MTAIVLIIASALTVGLTALGVLLWAMGSGQYDDPDGDAERILLEDNDRMPEVITSGRGQYRNNELSS
jgi:cbb3-type cytochrome oxidase maturation protein